MMNEIGETKQWRPIAVGRVMTCVLGMIVQREREIRDFNETIFFRIYATLIGNDTSFDAEWKANENSSFFQANKLYKDNGFFNRDEATNFINQLQNTKTAIVKSIEKKKASWYNFCGMAIKIRVTKSSIKHVYPFIKNNPF